MEKKTAVKGISPKNGDFKERIKVEDLPSEISPEEEKLFLSVIDESIAAERLEEIESKGPVFPGITEVMALHWHPEFVPLDSVRKRFEKTFPDMRESVFIPTQHNEILSCGEYSGMEIDCYSREFGRKVQLLIHFKGSKEKASGTMTSMVERTFKYRSSQMFELLDCLCRPFDAPAAKSAAQAGGASDQLLKFVASNAVKFSVLFGRHRKKIPPASVKNKLIRNYFDELRRIFEDRSVNLAQIFIKEAKQEIKRMFGTGFFYETRSVIEEARAIGAGVIVPHPEQFWPVLLAGYDVDGYEVWNPQSREYTEFLISVLGEANRQRKKNNKLVVFMGDDTHMGEKARPLELRQPDKAGREVGRQPAWEDPAIMKKLGEYGFSRSRSISEYKSRLG